MDSIKPVPFLNYKDVLVLSMLSFKTSLHNCPCTDPPLKLLETFSLTYLTDKGRPYHRYVVRILP